MTTKNHKAYDLIAIHAGAVCGLAVPPAAEAAAVSVDERNRWVELVADDSDSAKLRDELYVDFDRRLRDSGYGGDAVWDWFKETYGPIGRASIFRARAALRAAESRVAEVAADARAYMDLATAEGADGVFGAATQRAGQLIFQLLMELNASDLGADNPDPAKVAKILNALAKLQKARAETDMIRHKLAEIQKEFDEQVNAKTKKTSDGKLSPEAIADIRKAVFGEAA